MGDKMNETTDTPSPEDHVNSEETHNDPQPSKAPGWWSDIVVAFLTLTSIPVPAAPREERPVETALRGFPLIGALVGLIGGLTFTLFSLLDLFPLVSAGFAMGVMIWATGAMHERSLASFTGALFEPPANEAQIDSVDSVRGTLSVITLSLSLLIRVSLIAQIGSVPYGAIYVLASLIAIGALSRTAMVAGLYANLRNIAANASGNTTTVLWKEQRDQAFQAFILAAIIAVLLLGILGTSTGIVAALAGGLGAYWVYWLSGSDDKPLNSNALGAMQQASELASLTVVAALLIN